jgi:hypothetical protein
MHITFALSLIVVVLISVLIIKGRIEVGMATVNAN